MPHFDSKLWSMSSPLGLGCLGGNGIQLMAPWSEDLPILVRGELVTHGPCNCLLYDRMAQRPAKLENLIFVFLGVLGVESGLKPRNRGLTSDCSFNFLQDFQAILYHKLYCLLREIIHLLSADPEEGLPVEFAETLQPRLFSSEEFDAVSLLLSQKLIQRQGINDAPQQKPSFPSATTPSFRDRSKQAPEMDETLSLGCFIAGTIWSVLRHAGISPPNPVDALPSR